MGLDEGAGMRWIRCSALGGWYEANGEAEVN
jgi:hypothetical protein